MSFNLITILGPTATGKTKLAAQLSSIYNGEIISADSRQVYKGMDIGTGKDYADYETPSGKINYHLIDIIEPSEEYNLHSFKKDFINAFHSITNKGKFPFLAGGTGMYLSSVLQNYKLFNAAKNEAYQEQLLEKDKEELKEIILKLKPEQHNETDLYEKERIVSAILIAQSEKEEYPDTSFVNSLIIGVYAERDIIKQRITARLKQRLQSGMIEEVKALLDNGISKERLLLFGLEYKFIALYLSGELTYNDMYQKLNSAIHSFAKRQMTWFRKMEKEGVKINWIPPGDLEKATELVNNALNEQPS